MYKLAQCRMNVITIFKRQEFCICFTAMIPNIPTITEKFLDCREATLSTLKDINKECNKLKEDVKYTKLTAKTAKLLSAVAPLISMVCLTATQFVSDIPAFVLGGVAGVSSIVSIVVTLYKIITEKGLLKRLYRALDAERRVKDRLTEVVGRLRDVSSVDKDTSVFLSKAAKLGFVTTEQVNKLLKLPTTAKGEKIPTNVTDILIKVEKVMAIVSNVLEIISIPIEFLSMLEDLDSSNCSDVSKKIKEKRKKLENEYAHCKDLYKKLMQEW